MEPLQDVKHDLAYIHSELMRLETMAGTLSTIEKNHYQKLTGFEHKELMDMAVEEQSAARQLGTMKQMCLAMAQKIADIEQAMDRGELKGMEMDVQNH